MTPSEKLKRDDNGLLANPPVDYVFNEDGSVNWRKMVRTDYLVANKQRTQQTDVSQLEDRDLLILLGGIKELAQIRGFTDVYYTVHTASQDYFSTTCTIEWIPNYETDNKVVSFSALADAHQDNTYSFASNFLAATAENRAFVRCVRNFLKINIVGQEEMGGGKQVFSQSTTKASSPKTDSDPTSLLQKVMDSKGVNFATIKDRLVKENFPKAESFESTKDIPKTKTFELIARLKKL
jgi:hypothetical protein